MTTPADKGDAYLTIWGGWSRNRKDYGVGYASTTIEGRMIRDGGVVAGSTRRDEPDNPLAEKVELAVVGLDEHFRELVKLYYVRKRTTIELARQYRRNRDTISGELNQARAWIAAKVE